jgi:hypothetical protein
MRFSIESKYISRQRNSEASARPGTRRSAAQGHHAQPAARREGSPRVARVAATGAAILAAVACGSPGAGGPIIDRGPGDGASSSSSSSVERDASTAEDARAGEDATSRGETDGEAALPDARPADAAKDAQSAEDAARGPDASVADASGADAAHAADASSGGNDAATGSTCVSSLPAGWSLVAYNTAIDSCPTGYSENIVSGTPAVAAGACTCSCSVTQAGSCGSGSLAMTTNPGHGNDSCVTPWFTATVDGAQCIPVPSAQQGNLGNFQASPLAATATGGACTSTAHPLAGALTEPTQRTCSVPGTSADAVCNGNPPAGFSACIVSAGAKACPASTPFVHAFTVESGASLACGTCSACSVSTSCGSPTVSAFTNASCSGTPALSFPVNGTCASNPAEQTVLSIEYSANATGSCTAGTSAPTVTLAGEQTICCR